MDYISQPEKNNQLLNEPAEEYIAASKKKIRFFSSFQEQEDELISYWSSITPLQRMQHLHEMIIHSFGLTNEKLKTPKLNHSLKIIYYEP